MEKNNVIITVGRQLGSGGHIIADGLAKRFEATLYDKKLLTLAAKESGFCEEFFEKNDEKSFVTKVLSHCNFTYFSEHCYCNSGFSLTPERLAQFQSDAIRKAAEQENCVFVGRCADYVLRKTPHIVNVFVSANTEDRVERLMKRFDCNEKKALETIEKADTSRSEYYAYYTGKKWGSAESYHLCINSSILGLEQTEDIIANFVEQSLSKLGLR